MTGLVSLIILLIVIGALLYIAQLLPLDETVKRILTVVVIVAVAIYVLRNLATFGF